MTVWGGFGVFPRVFKDYRFILVNWKTRFKIIKFVKFKNKVIIKVKAIIKEINNTFKRYLIYLYYDKGKKIDRFRLYGCSYQKNPLTAFAEIAKIIKPALKRCWNFSTCNH